MSRSISDVLRIMRLAIGRRNVNDTDSTDTVLFGYIKDFMHLTMADEFKLHEQWDTLSITISATDTDGIVLFPDSTTSTIFANISPDALITLASPANNSVSWQPLRVMHDPEEFYRYWGINNIDILVTGTPTEVLYYGNQLVFRTIPNDTFEVQFFGYQYIDEPGSQTADLPFAYWMRFVAYGAAKQYAADYRLSDEALANIERNYKRERVLLMNRVHDQKKTQRARPRF